MKRELNKRAFERSSQYLFIFLIWYILLIIIGTLARTNDIDMISRIIGVIMVWSLILLLLIPVPLIVVKVFFKTKYTQNGEGKSSNNLNSKSGCNFINKLALYLCCKLVYDNDRYYQENEQYSGNPTHYSVSFFHLISPLWLWLKRLYTHIHSESTKREPYHNNSGN